MGDPAEETCRSPNQVNAKNVTSDCQRTVRNEFSALRRTHTFRPFSCGSAEKNGADCPVDVASLNVFFQSREVVGCLRLKPSSAELGRRELTWRWSPVRRSSGACFSQARLDGLDGCVCIADEMKKLLLVALALAAVLVSGCYSTETGSKKFGMPFADDKIESRYQRTVAQVFTAAKEVLSFNGTLTGENTIDNTLQAKVDNKTVWVRVDEIETGVARSFVQVRGPAGGADINLAAELDKQIALKLTQMR